MSLQHRLVTAWSVLFALVSQAGTLAVDWSTDKEPVSYQPGEAMTFKLQLTEDGKPLAGRTLKWLRTGDDGLSTNGASVTSESQPVTVVTSTDKPGFVRLELTVANADGTLVKDANGWPLKFEGGAGVQPERLEGYPEPADFDAFWQRQRARLAEVPATAEVKEVAAKKQGFKVYDVKVACPGGKPVSGYLSVPDGAKPKSLGAQVSFHGYGVGGANQESWAGVILFDINAHGIENGREPDYYKALQEGELKGYAFKNEENAKPETAYFNGMFLRVMRALEYVKARPEWNGKTLNVMGGSQGGLQAVAAAALDRDVTQCGAFKPWCCDLGGIKLHRLRGWRPDWADGLGYYDTANMGKRVTCPVTISAGLGDYVCPPSGVSVLYNNVKSAKKSIEYVQGSTHGYTPPNPKKQKLSSQ
jgi:cephalosporin-C deacetylase-like acetyl esterase